MTPGRVAQISRKGYRSSRLRSAACNTPLPVTPDAADLAVLTGLLRHLLEVQRDGEAIGEDVHPILAAIQLLLVLLLDVGLAVIIEPRVALARLKMPDGSRLGLDHDQGRRGVPPGGAAAVVAGRVRLVADVLHRLQGHAHRRVGAAGGGSDRAPRIRRGTTGHIYGSRRGHTAGQVHVTVATDMHGCRRVLRGPRGHGGRRNAVGALDVVNGGRSVRVTWLQQLGVFLVGDHLVEELRLVVLHLTRPQALCLVVVLGVVVSCVGDLGTTASTAGQTPHAEERPRHRQRRDAEEHGDAGHQKEPGDDLAVFPPGGHHEDQHRDWEEYRGRVADKHQTQDRLLPGVWLCGPLEPAEQHVLVHPVLHGESDDAHQGQQWHEWREE
mmetsp:Transcript_91747/g.273765  ORF Transcript_91747/g.273765 Transcript_91747/m.273765 type:complete len:383 (+) Transcript_91747:84-1232(+)